MKTVKLFLFLAFFGFAGTTLGQTSQELKKRKADLTREMEKLQESLDQTSSNKSLSLKQIKYINAQIRLRQEKISTMNSEIKLLDNQISDNTNTISSLQTQLNKLKKEYAGMVLFAFRNQSAYSKLMFIFASEDFNRAYKRLKYLQQFSEYRKKQASYIQHTQKDLGAKIVELDHNKQEKNEILRAQEREKQIQLKAKTTQSKVLNSLTKQEKQFQQELNKKRQEANRLNRLIQAAIRKEIEEEARKAKAAEGNSAVSSTKKTTSSSVLSATPESAKLSADFLDNRGRLPWPVANLVTVVEHFGTSTVGVNVKVPNDGIDIKTGVGAQVRAVFNGTVSTVGEIINGQKTVIIRHGEYLTVYSNLRTANVKSGDKVTTKQAIGTVATDSDDGTTELKFQIWKGFTPVNPELWLFRQ